MLFFGQFSNNLNKYKMSNLKTIKVEKNNDLVSEIEFYIKNK